MERTTFTTTSQISPRAVVGSRDPTVPTPQLRDRFEPMLRSKEGIERRRDVKCMSLVFVLWHISRIVGIFQRTRSAKSLGWKVVTFLGGTYVADCVTGVLHIYLDHRRCDLGDALDMAAYSFRYDHHAFPLNFLKDSALFPAGASNIIASATAPLSALLHLSLYWRVDAGTAAPSSELAALFCYTVILFGSLCQTTHALAHEGMFRRNRTFPNSVALLQHFHLILPPKMHGLHHMAEHDKNYCIFNGWSNPLFNRMSPTIFRLMRRFPSHFDTLAVPTLSDEEPKEPNEHKAS